MTKEWKKSVIYHIYPLGFCTDMKGTKPRTSENTLVFVERQIDHLIDLGITAVYFGPVFLSSFHGYDTADFYRIDDRLGSNEDFRNICFKLKQAGIKIILDGVFNHVGRDFWAFRDVKENGRTSAYVSWFSNLNFNANNRFNDGFSYRCWEGHQELVTLNLRNLDVVNHITGAVKTWIETFAIDGIRLDVAYALDRVFIKYLRKFCNGIQADFMLLGEVIHGNYHEFINENLLDSVTNYECYKALYSAHNDVNLFEIAHSLERHFGEAGLNKTNHLYNFLDNHDVNRIASTLTDPAWIHTAYILLFTIPGIPSVYYGSEWGVTGRRTSQSDSMLRPHFTTLEKMKKDYSVTRTVQTLIRIRKENRELYEGTYTTIMTGSDVFVFTRQIDNEETVVAVNISGAPRHVTINNARYAGYDDLLNRKERIVRHNGCLELDISPKWGRILKAIPG